jgi:hypothetical protein
MATRLELVGHTRLRVPSPTVRLCALFHLWLYESGRVDKLGTGCWLSTTQENGGVSEMSFESKAEVKRDEIRDSKDDRLNHRLHKACDAEIDLWCPDVCSPFLGQVTRLFNAFHLSPPVPPTRDPFSSYTRMWYMEWSFPNLPIRFVTYCLLCHILPLPSHLHFAHGVYTQDNKEYNIYVQGVRLTHSPLK